MSDQLERITDAYAGEPIADDGVSPRMPFPTSYLLTRQQEDELIDHAMKRLEQLESETGRDRCGAGDWWRSNDSQGITRDDPEGTNRPEKSWMGKRKLYDLTYANDVSHRAFLLGGIFAESNLVVPMSRRITRQMVARAVNYYFSTEPWFGVYPVETLDRPLADQEDRYVRWKTDQSKLKRSLEMAVERAFILGEAVVKTSWLKREQVYRTLATVLVDANGKDILATDGDYILESDQWVDKVIEDPATGETQLSGNMVLKRDGTTPQPLEIIWQEKYVTRRIRHYNGPEAKVIHFMDVLVPLDAPSIQEADCVVHCYDMPLMTLADQWRKDMEKGTGAAEDIEATKKAIDLIRRLSTGGGEPKNAQNAVASGTHHEQVRSEPIIDTLEFHLRYDADGDGMMEEVMLVIDRKTRTPIFYDYEANVTPDGQRPFSVVRVNEVPGRWYGIGAMEMFESSQQIVDLTINRWSFSQSRSARVDFWSPQNTLEGKANPNLTLNWGGTYTPAPTKKAEDCLSSVYLENNKNNDLREFSEFFMQLSMNESGVQHANDSQVAGMDSTKLATGIRNIEKSGQELFSLYLGHLEPGVSDVVEKTKDLIFANLDELEVYHYFETGEGGEGAGEILTIDPKNFTERKVNTRILLTRYRGEQILESSVRAVELTERFYAMMPEVQQQTFQLFRDMLKALQVPNGDKVITPMLMAPAPPVGMPNANAVAGAAAGQPRKSEANL